MAKTRNDAGRPNNPRPEGLLPCAPATALNALAVEPPRPAASALLRARTAATRRAGTCSEVPKERGSLGSRLHRGPDDYWYSYTQWPSAAAKAAGLGQPSVDAEAWQQMRGAIAESLPEIILEPVADFLAPIPRQGG